MTAERKRVLNPDEYEEHGRKRLRENRRTKTASARTRERELEARAVVALVRLFGHAPEQMERSFER